MDFSVFFKPSFDADKINKHLINKVDENGYTLLNYAIYYNDMKAASIILKAGAKVDVERSKYNNQMSIIQKWLSMKTPSIKSILYLLFEDWDEICDAIHFFELYTVLINSFHDYENTVIDKKLSQGINWKFRSPSNNHLICYINTKSQFDLCKKHGMTYTQRDVLKGINNFNDKMLSALIHDGFDAFILAHKLEEDDSRIITVLVQHRMYIQSIKEVLETTYGKVASDLHNETLEFL
jgi:hypothetical protein